MNNPESFVPNSYAQAATSLDFHATLAPVADGPRDRGWWLLSDIFSGRDAWMRVAAPSIADAALPLPRQLYAAAKRVADIVASLTLMLLLLPFMLLLATLVRLDSPGPAFFRQRRVGKDGREFMLWKFRSMYANVPRYSPSPTADIDLRLTRIGRLMRRVSLDELPQVFNVLRGEMSLVGPRPEMPFIVARYTPQERLRLMVKPGLTGLWQVSPARAYPIHKNLQYDLHYIHHQNLVLDGAILLRTVVAVIRGVGV